MAAPFAAPKTRFNANVTARRNISFAERDLADVKTVEDHFGVKVNDVALALVSGALRRFLLERDELPESALVAMFPVSVHDESDRPGRNQVSGVFSSLHTDIPDPAERLMAIASANSVAKQHSSAIGATLLQDWAQFAAPAVFGVPGPQVPLYLLGCALKAMYPPGPIFHRSGLNITVMSLTGKSDVGLISFPELLPDLWEMADDFAVELDDLVAACR